MTTEGRAIDPLATLEAHRRLLGTAALAGLAVAVAYSFIARPMYQSTGSVLPQARRTQTNLPAVAAQLGLSLNGDANQSPQFYVDLLESREILRPVVTAGYAFIDHGKQMHGTLADIYGIDAPHSEKGIEDAMEELGKHTSAAASAKTGVVSVAVRTQWPQLSALVLQHILEELNTFNLESRQLQASAERQFAEGRVTAARQELQTAEGRLQDFLLSNRDYRTSPKLTFDEDRLAREVSARQQVYTTMMQMYEQARMDEVRNTPLITVVERPNVPLKPESRHLLRNSALGVFVAMLIGLVIAFAMERRKTRV